MENGTGQRQCNDPQHVSHVEAADATIGPPPEGQQTTALTQASRHPSDGLIDVGFQDPATTTKPHAFVVMPFGRKQDADGQCIDFNAIYQDLIKPALEYAGFDPFRADEETVSGDILTDMFQELLLADLVIVDMSIDNANVFYELGVRHAFRKRGVVHIQSGRVQMPFDVFNVRTIPYHLNTQGTPDATYLERDRQNLIRVARDTWASDADTVHSPIFNLLTGLSEPDRQTLRTPLAAGFWREYNEWKVRVAIAQRQKRIGDILLLTEEISNPFVKEEAVAEAGTALREMGRHELALQQYRQGLAVNAKNITFRREEAFHLNHLGRVDEAIVKLENVLQDVPNDTETIGYLGHIYKDLWKTYWVDLQEPKERQQQAFHAYPWLIKAINTYLKGFRHDLNGFYAGINALTLTVILDALTHRHDDSSDTDPDIERLRQTLPAIRSTLWFTLQSRLQRDTTDYWTQVSLAEWYATTAEHPHHVARAYRKALAEARKNAFRLQSSLQQLDMLHALDIRTPFVAEGRQILQDEIDRILQDHKAVDEQDFPPPGTPVSAFLFAGHMLDQPGLAIERFPPALEGEVRRQIDLALDRFKADSNDHAFVPGAACGGDIIFIEACLARGLRVHVHLPYAEAPYIKTYISVGGGTWTERFYRIRNAANVKFYYQAERIGMPKNHANPYERNIRWTLYASLILGISKVRLLALWDGKLGQEQDFDGRLVSSMVAQMRQMGGMVEHLDITKFEYLFHGSGALSKAHEPWTLGLEERMACLRQVPLFSGLHDNDLKPIAEVATERGFGHGTTLTAQGEQGDVMFIIVKGEVEVTVAHNDAVARTLGRRRAGDYVGEMALIGNETRMASLVAVGDVLALCLNQKEFQEILSLRPETGMAVMRVLCTRLKELE